MKESRELGKGGRCLAVEMSSLDQVSPPTTTTLRHSVRSLGCSMYIFQSILMVILKVFINPSLSDENLSSENTAVYVGKGAHRPHCFL